MYNTGRRYIEILGIKGVTAVKRFLGTFLACLVVSWGFLFFGGAMIFQNLWALLVFSSLVLTVLILAFESQARHVEALEARLQALEERLAEETENKEEST